MKLTTHIENYIFEIEDFMTHEECDRWIQWSEDHGYEDALIISEDGAERNEEIRNNDRIIYDSTHYARDLWDKAKPFVPEVFSGRTAIGLNERFRFYRYNVGQKFDWHLDGSFVRENGEKSQLTFLVYLNDDYEGGTTSFSSFRSPLVYEDFSVTPKKGNALVFFHPIFHRGDDVISGMKYVIRTDVMYSAKEEQ
tara:strand:+ start:629 stop:1213 length:585 start_codon:yes stop_codon:yes gene_type:complete